MRNAHARVSLRQRRRRWKVCRFLYTDNILFTPPNESKRSPRRSLGYGQV
jgi:hypothetical protein